MEREECIVGCGRKGLEDLFSPVSDGFPSLQRGKSCLGRTPVPLDDVGVFAMISVGVRTHGSVLVWSARDHVERMETGEFVRKGV